MIRCLIIDVAERRGDYGWRFMVGVRPCAPTMFRCECGRRGRPPRTEHCELPGLGRYLNSSCLQFVRNYGRVDPLSIWRIFRICQGQTALFGGAWKEPKKGLYFFKFLLLFSVIVNHLGRSCVIRIDWFRLLVDE
jgi:hypothetical protein